MSAARLTCCEITPIIEQFVVSCAWSGRGGRVGGDGGGGDGGGVGDGGGGDSGGGGEGGDDPMVVPCAVVVVTAPGQEAK